MVYMFVGSDFNLLPLVYQPCVQTRCEKIILFPAAARLPQESSQWETQGSIKVTGACVKPSGLTSPSPTREGLEVNSRHFSFFA